jgi:hypothetical protein
MVRYICRSERGGLTAIVTVVAVVGALLNVLCFWLGSRLGLALICGTVENESVFVSEA